MKQARKWVTPPRQTGISMVELLVAMFLGLLLTLGLVQMTSHSSASFHEIQRSITRIENARYAMHVLSRELSHAGFYGHYYETDKFYGESLPSPCSTDIDELREAIALPVQAYEGGESDPTGCLSTGSYKEDTDVLVIRRAATFTTWPRDLAANAGRAYIQSDGAGSSYVLEPALATCEENKAVFSGKTLETAFGAEDDEADGEAQEDDLEDEMDCFNPNASLDIREFVVTIYYISTCDECAGGGDGVPTLKRVSLGESSGALVFAQPESVVRGVEDMQAYFGVDADHDGEPDGTPLKASSIGTSDLNEWSEIVTSQVFLLVRSEEETPGYTDVRTYVLGLNPESDSVQPAGSFKRNLYRMQVRINNPSDRRL